MGSREEEEEDEEEEGEEEWQRARAAGACRGRQGACWDVQGGGIAVAVAL